MIAKSPTYFILNIKHALAICWCLFTMASASATIPPGYYLSKSGNDMNPGTRDRPFKTVERMNREKLQPGSTIYLEGGTSFMGTLKLDSNENGTGKLPIKITSYGKGTAIIDGKLKEAIIIYCDHFVLSNINVRGAGRKDGNTANGIYIASAKNGIVENVSTEGFQKSGIEVYNSSNIHLSKVIAHDNGFCGIFVNGVLSKSRNIVVRDCRSDNNPGDPTILDNHSGNGILIGGSYNVLVDHCTATNNGWDMPRKGNGPVGIWGYESDRLVIQYCISYRNRTQSGASDGGGFDFDGGVKNSIIQYCLSYENEGSGFGIFQYEGASPWLNNTIRYCVSINDGKTTPGAGAFLIWNASPKGNDFNNCRVHNNVVYNDSVPAVRFDASSINKDFVFANNIFIGKDDLVKGPTSGEIFDGNVWWNIPQHSIKFRGYKSLDAWSDSTGQEKAQGKQVDPLLTGPFTTSITDPYKLQSLKGYQLKRNSPLTNMPSRYSITMPPVDFFGNPISNSSGKPGIHNRNAE